ncbi:MAG: hypothetical protein GX051_01540 [Clostridiales bacterium]|nr:hypothetical protein [Clostridiales bacterium]
MPRKKLFWFLCISYFLISIFDLLLTAVETPTLEQEGNPLVVMLEFGWGGLIAVNIVTYILFAAMAYYTFIRYKAPLTNETDVRKYLAYISYGDASKVNPGMTKLPKYWAPQIACLFYCVTIALPIARLIIVVEWILIILRIDAPLFFSIVSIFPMGRIDFAVALLIAWALPLPWITREFRLNLREIELRRAETQTNG